MATPSHTVAVAAVRELTPRMTRVTVTGPTLRGLDIAGAPEIALALIDETGRPVRRRYTARAFRDSTLELDIDVVLHGHGPGSSWGHTARAGDALTFTGPRGRIELAPAPWHLLVADEAGLPAVAALLEQAPDHLNLTAVLEVHDAAERQPLAGPPSAQVHWAHRDGRAPGLLHTLAAALQRIELPAAPGEAWILTESRAGIALRDELVARGVPRAGIHVKGYWNTGRERPTGPAVQAVESGAPIVAVVPITPT